MNYTELKEKYGGCSLCDKCQNTHKVFGSGNLTAKIAVVGEGPGKDEVIEGKPFVGEAGKLLNKILAGIKLKRDDIFFTNAILCRTDDKNRTPTSQEYINCRKRLFEELSIVKPKYTILTGNTALKSIMGDAYRISECHGNWYTLLSEPCFFYFSLYHPAWILHSVNEGEEKAKKITVWKDVKFFHEVMTAIENITYPPQGENK
jgi:uracil-DNA glycosylase family 4